MPTDITILGMGNMGQALARAHLKSSRSVTIWNRNASRSGISDLVSSGAQLAPTLHDAIRASKVLAPCLLTYEVLREMFEGLAGGGGEGDAVAGAEAGVGADGGAGASAKLLDSLTVINVTNSTPKQARDMEGKMREWGVGVYIDAALMASPLTIGTPESFVLCSGSTEEAFNRTAKDFITPWGVPRYFGPDSGAAEMYDAALLAGMYGVFAGGFTALAMLRKAKKTDGGTSGSLADSTKDLLEPFVHAMVPFLSHIAGKIDEGDDGDDGHQVGMLSESFMSIARACEDEGIDAKPLSYFFEMFHREVKNGNGGMGPALVAKRLMKD